MLVTSKSGHECGKMSCVPFSLFSSFSLSHLARLLWNIRPQWQHVAWLFQIIMDLQVFFCLEESTSAQPLGYGLPPSDERDPATAVVSALVFLYSSKVVILLMMPQNLLRHDFFFISTLAFRTVYEGELYIAAFIKTGAGVVLSRHIT